ncbi:tyrosine-type recombinase/integrase [Vibrio breoganii]
MASKYRVKNKPRTLTYEDMEELGLFADEITDELEALFAELTDFNRLYEECDTPQKRDKFLNYSERMIHEVNSDLSAGGGRFDFGWETRAQPDDTNLTRYKQFEEMFVRLTQARVERINHGTTQHYYSLLDEARNIKSPESDNKSNDVLYNESSNQETHFFSCLWEAWATEKQWSEKMAKEYERQYEFFISLWGDIDVKSISKQSIRDALKTYALMPAGNVKPFNKMTIEQRLEFALESDDSVEYKQVSPKTVQGILKTLQGFFSTYLTNELDLFETSPTQGVKYDADDVRRGSFNKSEMQHIVDALDNEQTSSLKWAGLIAVHSGMRRSEILHAMRNGLQRDSDTQVNYFHVTEGKTDNAVRKIPVSEHLIKRGLLNINLLEIVPDERVLSRYIESLRYSLGIPKFDCDGLSRTFHSLRHTFITYARQNEAVNLSLLQEVVGHSKSGGLTDRYTHKFALDKTKAVVDSVCFD